MAVGPRSWTTVHCLPGAWGALVDLPKARWDPNKDPPWLPASCPGCPSVPDQALCPSCSQAPSGRPPRGPTPHWAMSWPGGRLQLPVPSTLAKTLLQIWPCPSLLQV